MSQKYLITENPTELNMLDTFELKKVKAKTRFPTTWVRKTFANSWKKNSAKKIILSKEYVSLFKNPPNDGYF